MALNESSPDLRPAGAPAAAAGMAPAAAGPMVETAAVRAFADAAAWSRLSEAESLESFAAAWLELQCRLMGGTRVAAVLLQRDDGDRVPLAVWPPDAEGTPALAEVAELAIAQKRGAVRREPAEAGSARPGRAILAYPLLLGERPRGVAVVWIDLPAEAEIRLRSAMRLLQWGCAWWHRRLAGETLPARELSQVLRLLTLTLQEERFLAAATAFVTELAAALHCERVSFGARAGRHTQVRALSHTANFDRKSALIRALGLAMDEALDQQETLTLPAPDAEVPLVTRCHRELMEQHGSRAICTLPLADGGRPVGALTLERGGDTPFDAAEIRLCEYAATLIGPVLEARRREDRWIGAKLWESLQSGWAALLGPGHLTLKTLLLAGLAAALFLTFATGMDRVGAPAVLEGTVQRAVTAPQDGYIASAAARAGDLVAARQELAALEDTDLRLEKVQAEGEREQYQREYSKALAERERARVRILGARLAQSEARIALLTEQLARTRIAAPFAGVVVSGDLSQSLGAPVSRGDVLFEIAPLDSYRVILSVDERDVARIQVGQTGRLALAGLPGEPLSIRVGKITPVSRVEEGQNRFRVEVALESSVGALRPGMRGVGKIEVGERKLAWIWTHRLVYWLRLWWWSWRP